MPSIYHSCRSIISRRPLAEFDRGLVLVRCFNQHLAECHPDSMHFGFRPMVASYMRPLVALGRMKNY